MGLRETIKKEWKFVIITALIIVIITSLPHIFGYLNAKNKYYTAIQALNPHDPFVYYSYIQQAKDGHWLFKDLYTSEPQQRMIFNPLWLWVGLFGKIFSLSNVLAFQLSRIILILVFIVLAYLFISYFFENRQKRKVCLILLIFSSGLGAWMEPLLRARIPDLLKIGYLYLPPDIWVAESNTFLTLYNTPHFIASLSLIILIFSLMLLSFKNGKIKYSIFAGVAALALFFFHPYHLPLIFLVLGIYILVIFIKNKRIIWQWIKYYLILLLFSLPAILYHFRMLDSDPLGRQRAIQNLCITPPLWLVLAGYGFLIIFAPAGIYFLLKNKKLDDKYIFIITWLIVQFLIIYFPINFQRRFIEGLHVPLVVLTTIGLSSLYRCLQKKLPSKLSFFLNNKTLAVILFVILFCTSNLCILTSDLTLYYKFSRLPESPIFSIYPSKETMESIKWLKENTSENSIILANTPSLNELVPAFSGRIVYIGHWGETLFLKEKLEKFSWFLTGEEDDIEKYKFLQKNRIDYLFWSKENGYTNYLVDSNEKKLGFKKFIPEKKDYLERIFEKGKIAIYRVN